MLISLCQQSSSLSLWRDEDDPLPHGKDLADGADSGSRLPADSLGGPDKIIWGNGEKQLEVLAPTESKIKSGSSQMLSYPVSLRSDGDFLHQDLRSHPALFSDVPHISSQAIADVDHGMGYTLLG